MMKQAQSITIQTSDYTYICKMDNHSVVHVLMNYAENPRFRKLPSLDNYDGFFVRRYPNQVVVSLIKEAVESYRVIFIPTRER